MPLPQLPGRSVFPKTDGSMDFRLLPNVTEQEDQVDSLGLLRQYETPLVLARDVVSAADRSYHAPQRQGQDGDSRDAKVNTDRERVRGCHLAGGGPV